MDAVMDWLYISPSLAPRPPLVKSDAVSPQDRHMCMDDDGLTTVHV